MLCISTLLSTRHKFNPRATTTVFIGYPHGYKGYKLLDLTTLKTFISRDVKFYEHIFPFQDKDSTTRSTYPLSPHITPNLITLGICDDPDPIHTQYLPGNQPGIQNNPQPNPFSEYQLRRSTRQCGKPRYLTDYHCYNVTMDSKPLYPIQNYINYSKLTTNHTHYICQILKTLDTLFYSYTNLL